MKIAVYDTYVTRKDNRKMHFDILVEDKQMNALLVLQYGEVFLAQKNEAGQALTTKECRFCHIATATPEILKDIIARGFSIIEMENCD